MPVITTRLLSIKNPDLFYKIKNYFHRYLAVNIEEVTVISNRIQNNQPNKYFNVIGEKY